MADLVLTVVGDDRAGLVSALADRVSAAGANWEQSELAELAGAFAGIVLVSVPDDRVDELTDSLRSLDGLLKVAVHAGGAPSAAASDDAASHDVHLLEVTVLGNGRPGIVRDVSAAIAAHALSIETFRSRTLAAPMAGGTLFEATAAVRLPAGADASQIRAALEELASEIQVDLTVV